jgi:ABC-type sulfate/molybdate transport systems ATPase subunit
MSTSPPLLEARSISHRYGGVAALDQVSLTLRAAEVTALVGGNGAGKSTLLRMLAGLVRPDEGRVEVAGRDVAGCKVRDLVGTVGIVLPHPDRQLTEPTVAGEVGFTLRRWQDTRLGRLRRESRDRELDDVGADDVTARVRAVCQLVGLDDTVMDEDPRLLPRAPRRFVALASALALDPPILVLDEPSADLDATWRARLRDVVRTVRDRGTAVLLAENDIDLVAEVADDVTLLGHGRVVLQGRLEEVLAEPNWRTLERARTCPPRAALLGQVLGVPAFSYDQLVPAGVEVDDA